MEAGAGMTDAIEPTQEELDLQQRLQTRAGVSVPIEVIQTWSDHERKYCEIWADNDYYWKRYQVASSNVAIPMCLRPFIRSRR